MKAKTNPDRGAKDLTADVGRAMREWQKTVEKGLYDDRDCHFFIDISWSYGNDPKYRVRKESGIATGSLSKTFSTYEEALRELLDFLEEKTPVGGG